MWIQQPVLATNGAAGVNFLQRIFGYVKIQKYFFFCFMQTLKRTFRLTDERFSHFQMFDTIDLGTFKYDESLQKPRGKEVDGRYFSYGYQLEFNQIPNSITEYILKIKPIIEMYFGADVLISKPNLWKNFHIPSEYYGKDIFSECFHQDLVKDQYNMQLFILLHNTGEDQGPFEFLDFELQMKDKDYFQNRNRIEPKSGSHRLLGKRGDVLLFSTGATLHRAGNPKKGQTRDIMSVAFFPKYSEVGVSYGEFSSMVKSNRS